MQHLLKRARERRFSTAQIINFVSKHNRPPNFMEKFPEWIAAISKTEAKP